MQKTHDDIKQCVDETTTLIHQRIASEPAFKVILYKMLSLCSVPKKITDIELTVLAYPEMNVPLQTPQVLLSWLIQCQAISNINVSTSDEALYQTTLAGLIALEQEQSSDKIMALFNKEPEYQSVYLDIISLCKEPKSRMEIEKHLADNPILEQPKIYPSYFIDSLESAGGLEWNNHWVATQTALSRLV